MASKIENNKKLTETKRVRKKSDKRIEGVNIEKEKVQKVDDSLDFITNLDYSSFGLSSFNTATQSSYARDEQYNIIDIMGQDDRCKAILDVYTQYICGKNLEGDSVWAESSVPEIKNYVQYLIRDLNINKNIYTWTYSLLKYGDLYLKLFKNKPKPSRILNEQVRLDDEINNFWYSHRVEAIKDPGEMFELRKDGKTACFIKIPENSLTASKSTFMKNTVSYSLKNHDTVIYSSTDFVHIALKDGCERAEEEIEISLNNSDKDIYTINSGESLLLPSYKVWRQLQLLENSALLDEVVRSSVVRFIEIDGGDMPKEQVQNYVTRLKSTIEQKAAVNVNANFSNYTEPSPIQNIVYTVRHGTQGSITTSTLGGDSSNNDLTNLDWWNNRFYGSFGIPKQYFGWTDDSTGFNGGSSLSIISSVFGKSIPVKQTAIIEGITTLINIILLSEGKIDYVNQFKIKMVEPTTQESVDEKESLKTKIDVANQLFTMVEPYLPTDVDKLKVINSLIPSELTTQEFRETIQDVLSMNNAIEEAPAPADIPEDEDDEGPDDFGRELSRF